MEKIRESFNPKFTCDGVTLHLAEIQRMKRMKSISFMYVEKNNWIENAIERIFSIFKKDYKIKKYRMAIITNPCMTTYFNENGNHKVTIKFSSEAEFGRIMNYNKESLYKSRDLGKPKICTNLSAIQSISWVEKIEMQKNKPN